MDAMHNGEKRLYGQSAIMQIIAIALAIGVDWRIMLLMALVIVDESAVSNVRSLSCCRPDYDSEI
eukprot:scaffold41050_cov86-Cyclotella_meneghiniana.AAC.1